MKKEEKSLKKPLKIKFKRDPIWARFKYEGKYEGYNFSFRYKEFYDKELEEIVKAFEFSWPGRVPDNKSTAEKAIQQLFSSGIDKNTFEYRVTNPNDKLKK